MCKKKSYVVGAAIVVTVVTMLFFPLTGTGGSLDPGTVPAPTMKTLDQIPPTWGQKLQCDTTACPRFQLVLDGISAVLDKETGLVWEQSPSTTAQAWAAALQICDQKNVGGRYGWHLPTVEQLASLMDPTATSAPFIPSGSPFTGVLSSGYWSASTNAFDTTFAWHVNFGSGIIGSHGKLLSDQYVWCVRGGQTYDGL